MLTSVLGHGLKDHIGYGLDDGFEIELDDMQAGLKPLNNRKFKVKRMRFKLHDPRREFTHGDWNFLMLVHASLERICTNTHVCACTCTRN